MVLAAEGCTSERARNPLIGDHRRMCKCSFQQGCSTSVSTMIPPERRALKAAETEWSDPCRRPTHGTRAPKRAIQTLGSRSLYQRTTVAKAQIAWR